MTRTNRVKGSVFVIRNHFRGERHRKKMKLFSQQLPVFLLAAVISVEVQVTEGKKSFANIHWYYIPFFFMTPLLFQNIGYKI